MITFFTGKGKVKFIITLGMERVKIIKFFRGWKASVINSWERVLGLNLSVSTGGEGVKIIRHLNSGGKG